MSIDPNAESNTDDERGPIALGMSIAFFMSAAVGGIVLLLLHGLEYLIRLLF